MCWNHASKGICLCLSNQWERQLDRCNSNTTNCNNKTVSLFRCQSLITMWNVYNTQCARSTRVNNYVTAVIFIFHSSVSCFKLKFIPVVRLKCIWQISQRQTTNTNNEGVCVYACQSLYRWHSRCRRWFVRLWVCVCVFVSVNICCAMRSCVCLPWNTCTVFVLEGLSIDIVTTKDYEWKKRERNRILN